MGIGDGGVRGAQGSHRKPRKLGRDPAGPTLLHNRHAAKSTEKLLSDGSFRLLFWTRGRCLLPSASNGLEGCQGAVIGVGEPAEILLGGLDLLVAEAIHHCLEVCAAGQQPRGVRATQVVGVNSFQRGHVIERLTQDVRAIELFAGRTDALREAVADEELPRA